MKLFENGTSSETNFPKLQTKNGEAFYKKAVKGSLQLLISKQLLSDYVDCPIAHNKKVHEKMFFNKLKKFMDC